MPFGEYIPFEGVLDILPDLAGSQDIMSYSRGSEQQSPLQVRGHSLGSAVCYEVAYPDTTRKNAIGTDFLLTISNDAWFGTSAGPLQHLQMVQMRALENGRWFMRATNTGVTAIIDHKGRIVERTRSLSVPYYVVRFRLGLVTRPLCALGITQCYLS